METSVNLSLYIVNRFREQLRYRIRVVDVSGQGLPTSMSPMLDKSLESTSIYRMHVEELIENLSLIKIFLEGALVL